MPPRICPRLKWPPDPETILRYAPLAFAAITAPIIGLIAISRQSLTDDERKDQKTEASRRAAMVTEMIQALEAAEAESDGDNSAKPKLSNAADEGHDGGESVCYEATQKEEDDGDGDDDQINTELLMERCRELVDVDAQAPVLQQGFRWIAKLLVKELRIASRKTREQNDIKYADGEVLQEIRQTHDSFWSLARDAKVLVQPEVKIEINLAMKEAASVQRSLFSKHVIKALKVLFMLRKAWPWMLAGSLAGIVGASVSTLSLYYKTQVMETLHDGGSVDQLRRKFKKAAFAMLLVNVLHSLINTLEAQLSNRSDTMMAEGMQLRVFKAIMSKDLAWWEKQKEPWALIWEVLDLPRDIQSVITIPRTVMNKLTVIVGQAWLVRQKSSTMLRVVILMNWANIVLSFCIDWMWERATKWTMSGLIIPSRDQWTWTAALNPRYIKEFQGFSRGAKVTHELAQHLRVNNQGRIRGETIRAIFNPLKSSMSSIGTLSHLTVARDLVQRSHLSTTTAEALVDYSSEVAGGLQEIWAECSDVKEVCRPLAKAYDYISIPSKIDPDVGITPSRRALGHIEFKNVEFHYPSRKVPVLKGASFEANVGEVVGITGGSGCGKSTCMRLLQRFYDVTNGQILLDGRDLRDYSPEWVRSQVGIVSQEPVMLPYSLRQNLVFGCKEEPNLADIEKACKTANVWTLLSDPKKFPKGLDTRMDAIENVSGGEKQRLCIARAILANPTILLLDEATSALDEVSQEHVQAALNELMKGRTTLMVAHRLTTIMKADKIVAMKDGNVDAVGTHCELLSKPGVYKELWERHDASNEKRGSTASSAELDEDETNRECLPSIEKKKYAQHKKISDATEDIPECKKGLASTKWKILRNCVAQLTAGDGRNTAKFNGVLAQLEAGTQLESDARTVEALEAYTNATAGSQSPIPRLVRITSSATPGGDQKPQRRRSIPGSS